MPTLDQDRTIKEYWNEVSHKYPDIDFDRFTIICKAPFEFIKKCIREDSFPIIMIKYLGKMRVFPTTVRRAIKCLSHPLSGIVNTEKIDRLTTYLKDIKEYDEKYKDTPDREIIIE